MTKHKTILLKDCTPDTVRLCQKCNRDLPGTLEYFYANRDLLDQICKECTKEYAREYYKGNKSKHAQRGWSLRLSKYGFTPELYYSMLEDQKGLCALCKNPPEQIKLAADHNHNTGKARGLLCHSCNIAVGYLEKYDEKWLSKAKKYIKEDGFYKP